MRDFDTYSEEPEPLGSKNILTLLRVTFASWNAHKAPKMGAALAYYAVFSLAPLAILTLSLLSVIFERAAARRDMLAQLSMVLGKEGTATVDAILTAASSEHSGTFGTMIGFAVLIFGASGVFAELQDSLNTIWEVPTKSCGTVWCFIKERFPSFAMVFVIGFLLVVSMLISAAVAGANKFLSGYVTGFGWAWECLNFVISFGVITAGFAILFRVLPDAPIGWRDVALGATVTALLFLLGKFLLGLYIGRSAIGSTYGAAGSLVVVLLWVFYSAQIFFFGAELTRAYTKRLGSHSENPLPTPPREHLGAVQPPPSVS